MESYLNYYVTKILEKFLNDLYVCDLTCGSFNAKEPTVFIWMQNKLWKKVVQDFINGRQIPSNKITGGENINSSHSSSYEKGFEYTLRFKIWYNYFVFWWNSKLNIFVTYKST